MSQVTMGLGFPKAVQVMVMLPPSLASMYWGGVSVKVGGAAKDSRKMRDGLHLPVQNSATFRDKGSRTRVQKLLPGISQRWGDLEPTDYPLPGTEIRIIAHPVWTIGFLTESASCARAACIGNLVNFGPSLSLASSEFYTHLAELSSYPVKLPTIGKLPRSVLRTRHKQD